MLRLFRSPEVLSLLLEESFGLIHHLNDLQVLHRHKCGAAAHVATHLRRLASFRRGDEVEIGFTLARAAHGRGLATAAVRAVVAMAFAQTSAQRVVGITDARNAASSRLLERVGLRLVATQHALFRGEACVEHVHAIDRAALVVDEGR